MYSLNSIEIKFRAENIYKATAKVRVRALSNYNLNILKKMKLNSMGIIILFSKIFGEIISNISNAYLNLFLQ